MTTTAESSPTRRHNSLICRRLMCFTPSVETHELSPVSEEEFNRVTIPSHGGTAINLRIGRGPLEFEMPQQAVLYFEHGQHDTPGYLVPGLGPMGAGLRVQTESRRFTLSESESIFLIDCTACEHVELGSDDWARAIDSEIKASGSDTLQSHESIYLAQVERLRHLTKRLAERATGCLALYLCPLVWQKAEVVETVFCVDSDTHLVNSKVFHPRDTFIAARLNFESRIGIENLRQLLIKQLNSVPVRLDLPLLLLQECLWDSDIRARFLRQFWILEHLVWSFMKTQPKNNAIRECARHVEQFLGQNAPELLQHFKDQKFLFVNPTLREATATYLNDLGVQYEDEKFKIAKNTRDAISHGKQSTEVQLRDSELFVRHLVWHLLRLELERDGVDWSIP